MTDLADADLFLSDEWMLGASSFNWTPDIVLAQRDATEIVRGIVADGVSQRIELEAGSVWRSFPAPVDGEVDALREALDDLDGSVSVVGVSIDDFASPTLRRTDDERLQFVLPQLRAAHRVGAAGVRLPIGQAGLPLLRRLQPVLHNLDLTLYEEAQGHQTPADPATASALEIIADLDDPRIRVLVDISMLMPALPTSYLEVLAASGLPADFVALVTDDWQGPHTHDAVVALLRSGRVPGPIHTLYMNMLVRFGRSDASVLQGILPLIGAIHLKFWDLDDADNRVTAPIEDLGRLLRAGGFRGSLTSEWGGHEWLDGWDSSETTRRHLALARSALSR